MKKAKSVIIIVLAVLIMLAGLLLAVAGVGSGWIFAVVGVLLIVWQKLLDKKAKKETVSSSASDEKDNSLFLAVAGVTFKNDDGSSRQRILKQIAESSSYTDSTAYLERYLFEGEDAISVSTVLGMVGNIRRTDVQKVLPIIEGGYIARIYPETFEDENDKLVYRADVKITPLS